MIVTAFEAFVHFCVGDIDNKNLFCVQGLLICFLKQLEKNLFIADNAPIKMHLLSRGPQQKFLEQRRLDFDADCDSKNVDYALI